jgi:hypothetical protein
MTAQLVYHTCMMRPADTVRTTANALRFRLPY